MAINRQVGIFINGREIEGSLKAIRRERNKLINVLKTQEKGTVKFNKAAADLKYITPIYEDHRKEVDDLIKSTEKLGDKAKESNSKIETLDGVAKKITGGLTKFAGIAGIAFGVGEIIGYGKELFQLNVKMEQLTKKAATVFGQALPAVTRAAEENASAMGFTTGQYVAAATALGDLLIPLGFTREQAAANSVEMINLAGALSEWTGGQRTAEEVSQTLAKALTGEREELKSLGIVINEEDIKMRLREKGLEKLTGQYLKQAKALATLELITERSVDAQTAYADNSDTLARRQAELAAKVSDVQAKLAVLLLPVLEKVFSVVELGVGLFGRLSAGINESSDSAKDLVDSVFAQQNAFQKLEGELAPLLDRYDELKNKTELSGDEQEELGSLIARVAELTPAAISKIDDYGNALEINAGKSRKMLEAEKALLQFVNEDSISTLEERIVELNRTREEIKRAIERGSSGRANIVITESSMQKYRDNITAITEDIEGATLQLQRFKGEFENEIPEPDLPTGADAPDLEAEAAAAAAAKAREKAAEKQLKARQKQLERLADVVAKAQETAALDQLSEDERQLEQIRLKYDKQIAIANELENAGFKAATAQRLELERLRDEELTAVRDELFATKLEKDAERDAEENAALLERQLQFDEDRRAVIAEIDEQVNEVILEARELQLQQLNEHYDELAMKAEEFGIDTGALEIARRRKLLAINKEFDKKDAKGQQEALDAKIAASEEAFSALGNVTTAFYDDVLNEQERATGAGKLLAFLNISISSAEGIAKAANASAGVPFPGNLAAIATSVASVLSVIGRARQALNATPDVPQRKDGGWMTVRGEDDKQSYRAKRIGTPGSGMLPDHPVLIDSVTGTDVLASERGKEYFVSNHDLARPAVFRHVSAIDRLVRQRMDGGFSSAGGGNAPGGVAPTPPADGGNGQQIQLDQLTNTLNALLNFFLNGKIYALITDEGALDLRNKIRELEAASSGGLD